MLPRKQQEAGPSPKRGSCGCRIGTDKRPCMQFTELRFFRKSHSATKHTRLDFSDTLSCTVFYVLIFPFSFFSPPSLLSLVMFSQFTFLNHLVNLVHLLQSCFFYWLRWVFVAACGLSLVAASRGYSLLQCMGFSLRWLLLLRSTGSRARGLQ